MNDVHNSLLCTYNKITSTLKSTITLNGSNITDNFMFLETAKFILFYILNSVLLIVESFDLYICIF